MRYDSEDDLVSGGSDDNGSNEDSLNYKFGNKRRKRNYRHGNGVVQSLFCPGNKKGEMTYRVSYDNGVRGSGQLSKPATNITKEMKTKRKQLGRVGSLFGCENDDDQELCDEYDDDDNGYDDSVATKRDLQKRQSKSKRRVGKGRDAIVRFERTSKEFSKSRYDKYNDNNDNNYYEQVNSDDDSVASFDSGRSRRKRAGEVSGTVAGRMTTKKNKTQFKKYIFNPVIVVDYDLTLVDNSAKPFPASKEFIIKLRDFNDGQTTLVLYSHANAAHINHGLDKYYSDIKHCFDEIISDHSARNNKPVTHVRRVISSISSLSGPYIIIDDLRSNLDNDQYDIVIDVNRFTEFHKNTPVTVDYNGILCMMNNGVETFLSTKTPNNKTNGNRRGSSLD